MRDTALISNMATWLLKLLPNNPQWVLRFQCFYPVVPPGLMHTTIVPAGFEKPGEFENALWDAIPLYIALGYHSASSLKYRIYKFSRKMRYFIPRPMLDAQKWHNALKKAKISADCEKVYDKGCALLSKQRIPCYTEGFNQLRKQYPHLPLSYGTLWNRAQGSHQHPQKAHLEQQLLSPNQEQILETGHPISKRGVQKKAEVLIGKKPNQNWVYEFIRWNPTITLGKPSGLDPK
ncbi:hypothetical protein F5876DRAFT_69809 [Lentinula aff. lateritia]|uniref:Uncharacterized protein n=1 Tax=Lentinula aff. lateritia TaxID=2804960 RepID=A0ACC1TLE0_9AGAR|nr:hypothetical protein F5876DRAFT_69809 [Lentinula aff. lateritia]